MAAARGEGNGAVRGYDWAGASVVARGVCGWAERAFAGRWRGAIAGQGARRRAGEVALRAKAWCRLAGWVGLVLILGQVWGESRWVLGWT